MIFSIFFYILIKLELLELNPRQKQSATTNFLRLSPSAFYLSSTLQPQVSATITETSPRMLEMKFLSFIKHKVHDRIAKEKLNLIIFQLSNNYSITATTTPSACQMLQINIDSRTRKYIRRTLQEFNTSELAAG